eukprot:6187659-Pleurochrysis_carterae.AAC.2
MQILPTLNPVPLEQRVYGTASLFENRELNAPRESPASQEKFVAGLHAELDHDSPEGITAEVDEFVQSELPFISIPTNLQGNASYIHFEVGKKGENQRTKQGAERGHPMVSMFANKFYRSVAAMRKDNIDIDTLQEHTVHGQDSRTIKPYRHAALRH